MTNEEAFLEILKDVGPMTPEDRVAVAHAWFDSYKGEFFSLSVDDQRVIAKLYSLIRDTAIDSNDVVVPYYLLRSKYKDNTDAVRLCDAIYRIMHTYDGSKEHFTFVWNQADLPCTVDDIYAKVPVAQRSSDKYRDVYNLISNL